MEELQENLREVYRINQRNIDLEAQLAKIRAELKGNREKIRNLHQANFQLMKLTPDA